MSEAEQTKKPAVSFNWDLHYVCNYRCPYCWFYGKWQQMAGSNKYPSLEAMLKIWERIYQRHGASYIELIGGEPLIYPNIVQLVKGMSAWHKIGITSNLSVELNDFLDQIDPARVHVCGSFHPSFADFDQFLKRAVQLKQKGFGDRVSFVAYPPQIKMLAYYEQKFKENGILFSVLSFWGNYNGKDYPQAYTAEEKAIIDPYLGTREGEKFQLEPKVVKGKLCRAGQVYADIKADGTVVTCGGDNPEIIGNLFDEGFKLWEAPRPCRSETCPCNEWAGLLVQEEKPPQAPAEKPPEQPAIIVAKDIKSQVMGTKIDRSLIPPHRVFLTWDIHYGCNYQCVYCNTPKPWDLPEKWDKNRDKIVYPPIDKLLSIWQDIYDRYGSCEVHITGGEPFIYPSFLKLIHFLSAIHTLEIITNLSTDVEGILKNVTPDRVRIGTTFHPDFVELSEFLGKHRILRENGFETWANYVAYPPQMEKMGAIKKEFDKLGISLNLQPYMGNFNGKEYPAGYDAEELKHLKACYDNEDIVNTKTVEWKTGTDYKKTRDKLCRMGQMYAKIYPNGDAYRCCGPHKQTIGNLFDGTFKLLDEAKPCDCEPCFCWRCMLVEKEPSWTQHWIVPEKKEYKLKPGH